MRTMLKFSLDVAVANKTIENGTLPQVMQELMEKIHPEAAYFTTDAGTRTVFLFFDLKDTSDIPFIGEPLFQHFNAKLSFQPVMNAEELQKGLGKYMGANKR